MAAVWMDCISLSRLDNQMTKIVPGIKWPAIISAIFVIPFMALEWINRRAFSEGFPFLVFGLLWLLAMLFVLILRPVLLARREGKAFLRNPAGLFLQMGSLLIIAWLWFSLLQDQLPCFLGVPNCD